MGRRGSDTYRSRRAERGFTVIELAIVISIIGLVASFALPAIADARKRANETAVIGMLRAVHAAQNTYKQRGAYSPSWGDGFAYSFTYLDKEKLSPEALRPDDIWSTVRQHRGYRIWTYSGNQRIGIPYYHRMIVAAWPIHAGTTGENVYLMTEEGQIYYKPGSWLFINPASGTLLGGR